MTTVHVPGIVLAALALLAGLRAQTGSDYATPYAFTTLAGSAATGIGSADGTGGAARFNGPCGVAMDGSGNVYVADTGNDTIRKITADGVVTTFAGTAGSSGSADGTGSAVRFNYPKGVAVDGSGNVYVADTYNDTIRKVTAAGVVTTFAGTAGNSGSADGTGSAARFYYPIGVAVDGSGTVYVADTGNETIRKITAGGVVTTVAGTTGSWGSADGTGSAAQFAGPSGVAVDGSGNVYVADTYNDTIRKVTAAGVVTTFAGTAGNSGSADGTGSAARFYSPSGVAGDGSGTIYVADRGNFTIRKITPTGVVTTLAGTADALGGTDGTGSAALFSYPVGVAEDGSGNVYVADTSNHAIRKITPAGAVTTIAGAHASIGSADGTGSDARFDNPFGVAVDGSGNVYVADTRYNDTIRRVTAAGVVTTFAGIAGNSGSADGTGSAARFNGSAGVAVDGSGNVYVADTGNDTIRKITADGVVTTFAGTAGSIGSADGTGSDAQFDYPEGVAVDGSGNVYVADTSNDTIRKITADGVVTTLAGTAGNWGSADGTGSAARFGGPAGVAVDGSGNVYVADTDNCNIRKITAAGVVTTLAGSGYTGFVGSFGPVVGHADGPGSVAVFYYPEGVAVDGSGNVYVADTYNYLIRKITAAGVVTTLAGDSYKPYNPGYIHSVDGTGAEARFWNPHGIAVDGSGNVYVADQGNNTIRKGTPTSETNPSFTSQPSSQTVTAGGTTTFTVAASANPTPTYSWEVGVNGGGFYSWTPLTDTAPYGGTLTATLTITGATTAMSGYEYRCEASNAVQMGIDSNAAVLTVVLPAATANSGQSVVSNGFIATWNGVSGAAGYRLDVSTTSSFDSFLSGYNNLDVGDATSAILRGLNATTTYYYRVRAYDSTGAGNSSSTIAVTTSAPIVITAPLTVSTLAGQPLTSGNGDGTGSAARFFYPSGVAADGAGNLYLADADNHSIRKVVASSGAVTTLAGQAGSSGDADGTGSGARFNNPSSVAVDSTGNVYVADTLNNTLRKVSAVGAVITLAGTPGTAGSVDGTGTSALFQGPQGIAIDTGGNLYVADTNNHTIRKLVTSTGVVTTVAGLAGNAGAADGLASVARFNFPSGIAVDGTGNLFVADTENHTIRQILASGAVSTLAGLAGNSGDADGMGSSARFNSPSDLAVDSAGNIYVADTDNFTIRNVIPSTGAVTTLAGLAGTSGSADGLGSAALFFHPAGIGVDARNTLYVADTDNHTVRVGLLAGAPAIQTQPQSETVTAGSSVQFSVIASGRPAVTYQWYFGSILISGATASTYNLSNAQASNTGNYTVLVSNMVGNVTSNAATLTVNAPGGGGSPESGSSGSGGGGGAPSPLFHGALLLLVAARAFQQWIKMKMKISKSCVSSIPTRASSL